jgi:putative heme iron utilization protein
MASRIQANNAMTARIIAMLSPMPVASIVVSQGVEMVYRMRMKRVMTGMGSIRMFV